MRKGKQAGSERGGREREGARREAGRKEKVGSQAGTEKGRKGKFVRASKERAREGGKEKGKSNVQGGLP